MGHKIILKGFLFGLMSLGALLSWATAEAQGADKVEIREQRAVELPKDVEEPAGRGAATKYFRSNSSPSSSSGRDHYMGIHVGSFLSSESYVWGKSDKSDDIGKLNVGVTYRIGEWVNSADMLMRVEFTGFEVDDAKPLKMGFIFAAAFPDVNSGFPLYFGAGAGPGIFFRQVRAESAISLDYQIFGGVRFFNVFESVGFFGEAGIKNHFHLLSDGQFNGVFVALGAVFSF